MRKLSLAVMTAVAALALSACCGKTEVKETKMIRLNVTVTAQPEHVDEVIEGLNRMAAESQKEDGCIGYYIYQNTVAPNELVIVETWRDQAALDAHAKTPHYTGILPPLKDKMQTKLERFEY